MKILNIMNVQTLVDRMLRKGESQLRVGRENPQQQHSRTSWVRTSGVDFHNIPQVKWACPPRFIVDPNWKIEAGSETREAHVQIQRESRTAEAIYLHHADIPANPSVAPDALNFNGEDSCIPIIPVDVINDETSLDGDGGAPPITSSHTVQEATTQLPNAPPLVPQVSERPPVGTQHLLQRDEVIGTAVALVALIKSKEPGSQIDLELLIQLLRNPGMLEQLMKEHGLSTSQSLPIVSAQPQVRSSLPLAVSRPTLEIRPASRELGPVATRYVPPLLPGPKVSETLANVPIGGHSTWSPSVPFAHSISQQVKDMIDQIRRGSETQSKESMPVAPTTSLPSPSSSKLDVGKVRKLINEYGDPLAAHSVKPGSASLPSASGTRPTAIKDSDYYRRLVLQHGTAQENQNFQGSVKMTCTRPVESRPQEQRPCVYFNSPGGCRRGSGCWFQHVKANSGAPIRAPEEQGAKRMKPCGGNFARHT